MMKTQTEATSGFQQLEKHNPGLERTTKETQICSFRTLYVCAKALSILIGFNGSDQPHLEPPPTVMHI